MRNSAVTQPVALTCWARRTRPQMGFMWPTTRLTICSNSLGSSSSGYSRFSSGVIKTDFPFCHQERETILHPSRMLDPAMSQHQSGPNRRERTNPAWTLNSLVRAVGVLASLIGLGFQNRLGVEIPLVRPRRAVEGTQTMAQIKARTPGIAVSRSRSTVTD